MQQKRPNPFARFLDADFALNAERKRDGKIEHNIKWWADYLGIEDRSLVSRWYAGNRRVGTRHEPTVFQRLEKYWSGDARRWAPFRFSPEEYRAAVPTDGQRKASAKRLSRRRRLLGLRKTNVSARARGERRAALP